MVAYTSSRTHTHKHTHTHTHALTPKHCFMLARFLRTHTRTLFKTLLRAEKGSFGLKVIEIYERGECVCWLQANPPPVRTPSPSVSPSLFSFFPFSRAKATLSRGSAAITRRLSPVAEQHPSAAAAATKYKSLYCQHLIFSTRNIQNIHHTLVNFSLASLLRIPSLKEIHRSTFNNMLFP